MKVVIIGSGVVGAMIAYQLSKIPGLHITLVDKQTPAKGSTGAALGVLMGIISQKKHGRAWRLREFSLKAYPGLLDELQDATNIKIPQNRQGIVSLCFIGEDMTKWETLAKTRAASGWALDIWSPQELQQKCPHIECDRLQGAVYSPADLQINPTVLTEALVQGASIRGVKCLFGVEVNNIVTEEGKCSHLESSSGNLECDYLVISSGVGTTALTANLLQGLDIRPVLGQALQVKSDRTLGYIDFQPVITGDDVHLVPLGNNEYWLGATVEFPLDTKEAIPQAELLEQVRQQAMAFCPGLRDATTVFSWSGQRPRPQNQAAPIIEPLAGYSNIIIATGHYRNGVLLAPATAAKVVELLGLRL